MNVTIVDYGMGNIQSVQKKVLQTGGNAIITSDYKAIESASKIILPGVGHFGKAMENLKKLHLIDALYEAVIIKKKPVLGICLGMQIMAKHSEEGDSQGLGWFDAEVVRFNVADTYKYKVPHTGWNTIQINQLQNKLFVNIAQQTEFYFLHAYHIIANIKTDIASTSNYENDFTSSVHKENIYGVQYHPEKSHIAGQMLFKNFIQL